MVHSDLLFALNSLDGVLKSVKVASRHNAQHFGCHTHSERRNEQ